MTLAIPGSSSYTPSTNTTTSSASQTPTSSDNPPITPPPGPAAENSAKDGVVVNLSAQAKQLGHGVEAIARPLGQAYSPALFEMGDTNGDGTLSQSEFTALAQRGGASDSEAQWLYSEMGGTSSTGVTFPEFYNGTGYEDAKSIFSNIVSNIVNSGATSDERNDAMEELDQMNLAAANQLNIKYNYWS